MKKGKLFTIITIVLFICMQEFYTFATNITVYNSRDLYDLYEPTKTFDMVSIHDAVLTVAGPETGHYDVIGANLIHKLELHLNGKGGYSLASYQEDTVLVGGSNIFGYIHSRTGADLEFEDLTPYFNLEGLEIGIIHDCVSDGDKSYFLTRDRIYCYEDNTHSATIIENEEKQFNRIWSANGKLYILTFDGLYQYIDDEFLKLPTVYGEIAGVLPYGKDVMFVTSQGLFNLKENKINIITSNGDLDVRSNFTAGTYYEGKYYFGIKEKGVIQTDSSFNVLSGWNIQDGLKNNNVYEMSIDSTGNLWCLHDLGVSCIELNSVEPISKVQKKWLDLAAYPVINYYPQEYKNSRDIWALEEDYRGRIYAGTDTGIMIFDGGYWDSYELNRVNVLQADTLAKRIFVGGINELGYFDADKLLYQSLVSLVDEKDRDFGEINFIFTKDEDVYFVSTYNVFLYNGESIKTVLTVNERITYGTFLRGKPHFILERYKFVVLDNGTLTKIVDSDSIIKFRKDLLMPNQIDAVIEVNSKLYYLIGTCLYEEGSYKRHDIVSFDKMRDFIVTDDNKVVFLVDRESFVREEDYAFIVFDPETHEIFVYDESNGLNEALKSHSLIESKDGQIWIGSDNGLMKVLISYPVRNYSKANGIDGTITGVAFYNGRFYFGTSSSLLESNLLPDFYTAIRFFDSGSVTSIMVTSQGLFYSTNYGLYLLQDENIEEIYYNLTGIAAINAVCEKDGIIYFSNHNGVGAYNAITKELYSFASDIINIKQLKNYGDTILALSDTGNLYTVSLSSIGEPLKLELVKYDLLISVIETVGSQIWLGTQKGIFVMEDIHQVPKEISVKNDKELLSGNIEEIVSISSNRVLVKTYYPSEDALYVLSETNDGSYVLDKQTFAAVKNKNVYDIQMPLNGFVCFTDGSKWMYQWIDQPLEVRLNPIIIKGMYAQNKESISLDDSKFSSGIPYSYNSFKIEFVLPYMNSSEKTVYSYKLEGFDENWSEFSPVTSANYSNLKEGKYTFLVQAMTPEGELSEILAIEFTILPPWYRAKVAYASFALAILVFIVGVIILSGNIASRKAKRELAKKQIILDAAQRFVPKEFIDHLGKTDIVDVALGDCVQSEITVLFSDIRNFTSISEKMDAKMNFEFVNSYFNHMGPIIRKYNGFIDKYIGDAIMALFDKGADYAVSAAVEMITELNSFNKLISEFGMEPIKIGIGLNTGDLILGTVGEEKRMDTTVISDAVNTASRLEGLTKQYRVNLLISENTLSKLSDPSKHCIRTVDTVIVKGKEKPIKVFEVFDGDDEVVKLKKLDCLSTYEKAVDAYFAGDIETASKLFAKCLEHDPLDPLYNMYIERCMKA